METYLEPAKFRVVSDNVRLLGVVLPRGDYDGYLEWLIIVMHGHKKQSIARAMIQLDRSTLLGLGAKIGGLASADCPVLPYLHSGDVTIL